MSANQHINDLAYWHDIEVHRLSGVTYNPDGTLNSGRIAPQASRVARAIWVPKIESALDYMVALHEIGHILRNKENMWEVDAESSAWAWAAMHALDELSAKVTTSQWRWIGVAYSNYLQHA